MATISGIRDGLQTRLDTIGSGVDALRPFDVATGKEHVRMPCAIVYPTGWERMTSGGSTYRYDFVIEVYTSLTQGLARAQDQLDNMLDPTHANSIRAAIEDDSQLASTVDDLAVGGFTGYRFASLNQPRSDKPNALVARIPVEVWA